MVWKMFRIISKDGYCGAPGYQRSGDRWTGTVEACRGKLEDRGVPPWPEAGNECGRLPVREGPCVALADRTGTQGVPGFWTLLLQDRLLLGSHQSEDFSGSRQGIQGKTLDRTLPGNCVSPKYLVSSQLHRFFCNPTNFFDNPIPAFYVLYFQPKKPKPFKFHLMREWFRSNCKQTIQARGIIFHHHPSTKY